MVRFVTCFVLFALMIVSFVPAIVSANDDVDISAEVRGRGEYHETDLDSDTDGFNFGILRTRLNLKFHGNEKVMGFVQIQDSRFFGESGLNSGLSLDDDENVGLHQGYAKIKDPFVENLYFKFGRFEFKKGNERLFGAVGWSNFGRSFDGVIVGYGCPKATFELVGFQLNERYVSSNDDRMAIAAFVELKETDIDFFVVWDRDDLRDSDQERYLSRFTIGLYRHGEFDNFDYTTNLAYQLGNTMFNTQDIQAYLVAVDMGYTTDDGKFRIGGGVDMTSGDDDSSDDKFKTFDNLYYTGHKFRGHMDFFVSQPSYGLNDFYITGALKVNNNTSIYCHGHYFMSNVEFTSAKSNDTSKTSSVGMEIDAFIKQKLYDDFAWQIGVSTFMPSEDWAGDDSDNAFWLYVQTTASIK